MTEELAAMIENLPPLCASLPYIFSNGEGKTQGKIDNIECNCAGCGKLLTSSSINGEFTAFNHLSVSLRAFGICVACSTVTPIEAKYSSDGDSLSKSPEGWSRGRWGQKPKLGWGRRILTFIIGEIK